MLLVLHDAGRRETQVTVLRSTCHDKLISNKRAYEVGLPHLMQERGSVLVTEGTTELYTLLYRIVMSSKSM